MELELNGTLARIARMQAKAASRSSGKSVGEPTEAVVGKKQKMQPPARVDALRSQPESAEQANFLGPNLYDIGTRDSRRVMDLSLYRLSKKDLRANSRITYDLPDGYVTVTSGAYGMASVWDYDIVLMAVSYLTEAMNRFREGKGEKPGRCFRPHVREVLKFCRRENGGKQRSSLIGALERLGTTFVRIERKRKIENRPVTINEGENLIAKFLAISSDETGKLEFLEITIADWMYREVTEGKTPHVLSVHPDYFLIESGIGRFLYRLARRAAGQTTATWSFRTLYERSGSTSKFFEFSRLLRVLIKANKLPEYELVEVEGKVGPMLTMTYRAMGDGMPPESENDEQASDVFE